jgi:hypothetical protein
MTINLIDTLSVFGNMNFLSGYISHLETAIIKNKETDGFLHEAPNESEFLRQRSRRKNSDSLGVAILSHRHLRIHNAARF